MQACPPGCGVGVLQSRGGGCWPYPALRRFNPFGIGTGSNMTTTPRSFDYAPLFTHTSPLHLPNPSYPRRRVSSRSAKRDPTPSCPRRWISSRSVDRNQENVSYWILIYKRMMEVCSVGWYSAGLRSVTKCIILFYAECIFRYNFTDNTYDRNFVLTV